jgi:predicted dehydrogenase
MKLGLVGCGWIVEREHAPALLGASGVEVVAVADISAERARLVGGLLGLSEADCHTDPYFVFQRPDVDAVSIATPPNARLGLVRAAAAAGKQVVCEKPLATTLADADAMIEACERAGVRFGVYHNYLYFPETMLARDLIASGSIGEVVATEISGHGAKPWAGTDAYRPGWRERIQDAGGGALMDVAVHAVYLTEAYHGRGVDAVSAAVRYRDGIDVAGYCRLTLGHGVGLINIAWGHGGAAVRIIGTGGHIEFAFDENMGYYGAPARAVRCTTEGEPTRTWYLALGRPFFRAQMFEDVVREFSGERGAYPVSAIDGRRAIETIFAGYRSAATGSEVALPLPVDDLYTRGLPALAGAALAV